MTSKRIDPRHYLIITDAGRTIPVHIKRNPAALAHHFFDLDFRDMLGGAY